MSYISPCSCDKGCLSDVDLLGRMCNQAELGAAARSGSSWLPALRGHTQPSATAQSAPSALSAVGASTAPLIVLPLMLLPRLPPQGIVTQVSDVRPLLTVATYLDDLTGYEIYQEASWNCRG